MMRFFRSACFNLHPFSFCQLRKMTRFGHYAAGTIERALRIECTHAATVANTDVHTQYATLP